MFGDVGHFTVRSIQISMCTVTYPTRVLADVGQASFLRKNKDLVSDVFFKSIPGKTLHRVFAVTESICIDQLTYLINGETMQVLCIGQRLW